MTGIVIGEIWVAESLKHANPIPFNALLKYVRGNALVYFPMFAWSNTEGMVLEGTWATRGKTVSFRINGLSSTPNEALFDLDGVTIR